MCNHVCCVVSIQPTSLAGPPLRRPPTIHTYTYMYMYIYTHTHCTNVHVQTCMNLCKEIPSLLHVLYESHVHTYMYTHIWICAYVMYIYMYVCILNVPHAVTTSLLPLSPSSSFSLSSSTQLSLSYIEDQIRSHQFDCGGQRVH